MEQNVGHMAQAQHMSAVCTPFPGLKFHPELVPIVSATLEVLDLFVREWFFLTLLLKKGLEVSNTLLVGFWLIGGYKRKVNQQIEIVDCCIATFVVKAQGKYLIFPWIQWKMPVAGCKICSPYLCVE